MSGSTRRLPGSGSPEPTGAAARSPGGCALDFFPPSGPKGRAGARQAKQARAAPAGMTHAQPTGRRLPAQPQSRCRRGSRLVLSRAWVCPE